MQTDKFHKLQVTSSEELHIWLAANHHQEDSVWLITFKKHCGEKYVPRWDVLDELIAFGWIDGVRRKLDADRTMQLISPRQTNAWAASYQERAARLEKDGRMQPSGRAAIAASKKAGLWNAAAAVDALIIPPDLGASLAQRPPADENFSRAAPSYRRNVLRWIDGAKTPPTRAKRIEATVQAAAAGVKIRHL